MSNEVTPGEFGFSFLATSEASGSNGTPMATSLIPSSVVCSNRIIYCEAFHSEMVGTWLGTIKRPWQVSAAADSGNAKE